jgi:hypothetical protein
MLWYNPILTQTDLNSRIIFGQTPESEVLEFKRELVLSKINGPQGSTNSPAKSVDDNAREFARDIASFANSRGGTIVIGVDEGATTTGQPKAARAFVPVNDVTATLQKIRGDMVTKYLVPSTLDFTVSPISLATGDTVLAVNIPPFVGGIVAVWHSNNKRCVEYPYRTSFGKDYFNPTQAAERIMDAGRSMEIRFRHLQTGSTSCQRDQLFAFTTGSSRTEYESFEQRSLILEPRSSPMKTMSTMQTVWDSQASL